MNVLADTLNQKIIKGNPYILEMLSDVGKNLFFPGGILLQSAEAKEKAYNLNATIGIAKEDGHVMYLPSVMDAIDYIGAEAGLTYAPSFGIASLRTVWQKALYEKNITLNSDHKEISIPVVTCGITHAISIFSDVWVDPDDVLILPDMMWGNYNMIFGVRKKARISHYKIFNDKGGFNVEAFEDTLKHEAQNHKKLIVLLNFPHNPTGYSIRKDEAKEIIDVLVNIADQGTNIVVATDDAYFGLFYEEDVLVESLFAYLAGIHPRIVAVKLDGATKENYVWGLRVAFITYGCKVEGDSRPVYDALEQKTAGCIRGDTSNASHLGQSIVLRSMNDKNYDSEKQEKFEIFKQRALEVKKVLSDPKYNGAWDVYPFNSGYFMCIKLKTVDAQNLRQHLLKNYGVGLIALGKQNIRVAFSCIEVGDIQRLFDMILQGVRDLEK